MKEGIIGILGGMGPEATADLFNKIVKNTEAGKDQSHLRVVMDSNSKIPDRIPAMLGRGESPLPIMTESAKNLERAGADFIVIPCVSAHYFIEGLREAIAIPVTSIFEEVAKEMEKHVPGIKRTGLIPTTGTIRTGMFQDRLGAIGGNAFPRDTLPGKNQRMINLELTDATSCPSPLYLPLLLRLGLGRGSLAGELLEGVAIRWDQTP